MIMTALAITWLPGPGPELQFTAAMSYSRCTGHVIIPAIACCHHTAGSLVSDHSDRHSTCCRVMGQMPWPQLQTPWTLTARRLQQRQCRKLATPCPLPA